MIKLEQRTKVYGQAENGNMYDEIVMNESKAVEWCINHSLELFTTESINFMAYEPTENDFDIDYQELLSIMKDTTRCFDELSEAQENFMQTYIYFDGARLEKYYTRFYTNEL